MAEFYLKPDSKLFDEVARKWAEEIYGNKKDPLTNKNQIRNFYDKVLEFYDAIFVNEKKEEKRDEKYKELEPFIKMLNSKIEYAKGRKVAKGAFVDFMKKGINEIKNKEDLKNFKLLFEAVIGFFTGIEYERKGNK